MDAAKARLLAIWLKNPRQTKLLYFSSMSFRIGPVFSGDGLHGLTKDDYDRTPNPLFQTLRKRVALVDGGLENYVGASYVHLASSKSKQPRLQFFGLFGVEVNEIVGPDGRKKLYAVRPVQTMDENTSTVADRMISPPAWAVKPNRDDFANPSDIDWMFGVSDFTKIDSKVSQSD